MLPDEPNPELPPTDYDADQTVFFKRRRPAIRLLPGAVIGILVLGSGALVAWAFNHAGHHRASGGGGGAAAHDPFAGRPLISDAQAKAMEDPPAPAAPAGPPPTATVAPAAAPARAEANPPLNLDVNEADNAAVRTEVLQRIDLMPGISDTNKDKLYASVDHARKMGRVLTLAFDKGETAIKAPAIEQLKQQLQAPAIKALLDDPTVVFVILGYADPKGSVQLNTELSLSRARSVLDALKEKCGLQNMMHAVAMGGSTLFSQQEIAKNRVVEIWAVVP